MAGLTTGATRRNARRPSPQKVEGNPNHPASLGAASAFAQASILGLYDPDRAREVRQNGQKSSWQDFRGLRADAIRRRRRGPYAFSASKSHRLRSRLSKRTHCKRFSNARWIEYEPLAHDEAMAGAALAFGQPLHTHYNFEKADVVLSLDSDFLGLDSTNIAGTRALLPPPQNQPAPKRR